MRINSKTMSTTSAIENKDEQDEQDLRFAESFLAFRTKYAASYRMDFLAIQGILSHSNRSYVGCPVQHLFVLCSGTKVLGNA